MTEKDFWTKYFRAEYLHSTRNAVTVAAEAAEDEELAIFLRNDDILAREARKKVILWIDQNLFRLIISKHFYYIHLLGVYMFAEFLS